MLHVEILEKSKHGMKPFAEFPFALYKDDGNFVPPILHYQDDLLLGRNNTLLYEGECRFLMAFEDEKPIARVLVGVDRRLNERLRQAIGFFCLFDAYDRIDAVKLMLDIAGTYLKSLKVERIINRSGAAHRG